MATALRADATTITAHNDVKIPMVPAETGGDPDVRLTTIALRPATRDRLRSAGHKGETYDHLLNRLLDWYEAGKESGFELRTKGGFVRFEQVE